MLYKITIKDTEKSWRSLLISDKFDLNAKNHYYE